VKYTDGVSAISKGYSELVSGVSSLTKGSKKLATGASKIHRASSGMTDGVKKLLRGVEKLHDGTGEFCDKTKGMDTEVTDEINSEIASISGSDGETVSFVSAQNKNVTSVQFIIRTKAIKVRESEPKAAVKEKPATFWQRLSHLFGR
jgi:X-X-X-Leu-X-X-Gly heptad repeat protein